MRAEDGAWAHSYDGEVRLSAAAPAGPFAWYLTNSRREFLFVVFDLDAKNSPSSPEGPGVSNGPSGTVQRDVAELVDLLDEAELNHLICSSGPGGGVHVWVPVAPVDAPRVRAIARAAARRLPTLDISALTNARTGCVRPPGAPHRNGGTSVPLTADWRPLTPAATAAVLGEPNSAEALERLAVLLNATAAEQVPAETVCAIETGPGGPRLAGQRRPCDVADLLAATPEAGLGHAQLWRVLLRLARARWSACEVAALLERHLQEPGLVHLRRRTTGGAERPRTAQERAALLQRQWSKAVLAAASWRRPPGGVGADVPAAHEEQEQQEDRETWEQRVGAVVERVVAVRAAIDAVPERWCTQAGPSDRKALEYVLELALEAVTTEIELDCRRLAAATGMGRSTADRALRRLALDGWLALAAAGEGQKARSFTLLAPAGFQAPVTEASTAASSGCEEGVEAVTDVTKEALAEGGTQVNPRLPAVLRPPGLSPSSSPLALREELLIQLRSRREIVSHDLFTHPGPEQPGLGRHMAVTAAVLEREGSAGTGLYKVDQLSEMTGYDPRTVRRHLSILTGHQLARRVGGPGPAAEFERTPVTLSSVADRIGATGVRERRVRAYSVERDVYAWWLAEEEWMRTPGKRHRNVAIAGQGRLILAGAPSHANRPRYPRDHRGRADHQAARAYLRMQRDAAATRATLQPAAAA
ncbi:hypothetical protein [Streptosporangium sp. V21-05]|uniref:hypothetical protein n=1 Tax=Streptosporangium sp. V21-05 TaxID=3446115 RepID=UPI003F533D27